MFYVGYTIESNGTFVRQLVSAETAKSIRRLAREQCQAGTTRSVTRVKEFKTREEAEEFMKD